MGNSGNDILAKAGVDLTDWQKNIAKMTGDLSAVKGAAEKTSSSLTLFGRVAGAVAGAFAIGKVINFTKGLFNLGEQINDTARQVDVTAESFQVLQRATAGALSKGEFEAAISSITAEMDKARDGSIEASEALKELGVTAETVASGRADKAFMEIADGAKHAELNVQQLNKVFGATARAVDEVLKKGGGELRSKMDGVTGITSENAGALKAVNRAAVKAVDYVKSSLANTAGSIAGLFGAKSETSSVNAPSKPVAAVQKQKEETIDLAAAQRSYLDLARQSTISLEDQYNLGLAEVSVMEKQLALATQKYGKESLAVKQIQYAIHEREKSNVSIEHERDMTKRSAEAATANMEAEISGNKLLASLLQNRLSFELKITQAKHEHRDDVAEELRKQKLLTDLQIKAEQQRQTPKEKRDARKEQGAQNQAERIVMRREINASKERAQILQHGAKFGLTEADKQRLRDLDAGPQFADGRGHVSPATAAMRKEFLERAIAPKDKNTEKQLTVQSMKVVDFVAAVIRHG